MKIEYRFFQCESPVLWDTTVKFC